MNKSPAYLNLPDEPVTRPPRRRRPSVGRPRIRALVAASTVVVLALAAAGSAYGLKGASTTTYRTATVTSSGVVQTLQESGTIAPVSQATVSFPISGTVATVAVQAGQTVTTGQLLATLDTTTLQASLTAQTAALSSAQLTLQQALTATHDNNHRDFDNRGHLEDGGNVNFRHHASHDHQRRPVGRGRGDHRPKGSGHRGRPGGRGGPRRRDGVHHGVVARRANLRPVHDNLDSDHVDHRADLDNLNLGPGRGADDILRDRGTDCSRRPTAGRPSGKHAGPSRSRLPEGHIQLGDKQPGGRAGCAGDERKQLNGQHQPNQNTRDRR